MKKIQVTVEVPDDLSSIDHLELYVNQLGQKVKREILSSLVSQMIAPEKQTNSKACPHCKKKECLDRKPAKNTEDDFRGSSLYYPSQQMPKLSAYMESHL